ncbi:polyprotein of EF-Ts, chloroplastic isoform X2 [Rhodamnia argentea]|uniref:Elongation factor Ts, mitochondrial n=1 Tax=Rhodamnia argentea TaxID=178133 RepID=A0ABM3HBB3_9MYRT|nr:polyprotein of EF-Ts, chloroplastic isoform X2 [Rhodamnia argentea]
MTPVIPSSVSNITPIPGNAFLRRKNDRSNRCSILGTWPTRTSFSQGHSLPLPSSIVLFPRLGYGLRYKYRSRTLFATGTDVATEEQNPPVAEEDSSGSSESTPGEIETSEQTSVQPESSSTPAQARRSRSTRKSEMPPIKDEELVPGATFTGKVRSIQPFGAFVDFGAFTDGLVHVSQLSDRFVKDVGSIVSVGQEVKVRLLEANNETGRISLTMRESDDTSKPLQRRDAPASGDRPRPSRKSNVGQKRDEGKKSTKFVKGQDLKGTVKNLTRSGAFISLPEGEEGFLPTSEESDDGFVSMMGGSSLEIGQEVDIRVLRISRGQVTLTMKKEEDLKNLDAELSQGVAHVGTNPFVLAFRKNKEISAFLNEREILGKPMAPTASDEIQGKVGKSETASVTEVLSQPADSSETIATVPSTVNGETAGSSASVDVGDIKVDENSPSSTVDEKELETVSSSLSQSVDGATQAAVEEAEVSPKALTIEGSELSLELVAEEASPTDELVAVEAAPTGELVVEEAASNDEMKSNEVPESSGETTSQLSSSESPTANEVTKSEPESVASSLSQSVDGATQAAVEEAEVSPEALITGVNESSVELVAEGVSPTDELVAVEAAPTSELVVEEAAPNDEMTSNEIPESSGETTSPLSSSESPTANEIATSELDSAIPKEEEQIERTKTLDEVADGVSGKGNEIGTSTDDNGSMIGSDLQTNDSSPDAKDDPILSSDSWSEEVEETKLESATKEPLEPISSGDSVVSSEAPVEDVTEENGTVAVSNGNASGGLPKESGPKASISPALVKQLREETGAGMMDCKKALSESGGDIVKAQEFLRKKGLASAEKKASRATAEGRIGSYVHDSRIGVLIEVNCETDFVSRGDIFKELVDDLAMQVAACPQVQYLVTEDVPEEIVSKESDIEMQKEDLLSKPEQIRAKIVEGRIKKRLEELALLEQPYIKNDKIVVKDWVKQTIATIGENIKVRRFVRLNLGEGLEKKSQDFAAEVAAQTTAKSQAPPKQEEPVAAKAEETIQKPPTVAISAALVKQLREETGAGMMDCKKALSETGGNLEKAQEYLRKKGLSTADKKSSRLAAEGRIGCYIHDSRIGVLVEVNSETDFVGRSEKFKELVDDLAMQVVACPQVEFVSIDEIPESIVKQEKDLEMQREDLQSKPENIREKIVEGRVSKRLGELALLEQPFIKDDSLLVKDLVKQTVAALGENIKVRRFVKFTLGETIEDAKAGDE